MLVKNAFISLWVVIKKEKHDGQKMQVKARLAAVRARLLACRPTTTPRQNIDPERWGIFLMDVTGSASSVYMMRYGASIPLSGAP